MLTYQPKMIPSAARTFSAAPRTGSGIPSASISPEYKGKSEISAISNEVPSGIVEAIYRSRPVLVDAFRREPEIPTKCTIETAGLEARARRFKALARSGPFNVLSPNVEGVANAMTNQVESEWGT